MQTLVANIVKSKSYTKLHDAEDHTSTSSSEESQLEPRISTFKSPFFVCSTFLTTLILLLTITLHFRFGPTPPILPLVLPPKAHAFASTPSLHPFDLQTQETWKSLVPPGWSGVRFQSPAGQPLVAGIDMYHKVHCLTSIRQEFTALVTQDRHWYTFYNKETEVQRLHLGHCFDFLRQDILCAADATLEPLDAELKDMRGEGVVHECRDYSVVEDIVKKWRVD